MEHTNEYDEIINRQRPAPTRPRMTLQNRAKIFSPFAALNGHKEAVASMQEMRCNRILLSEYEKECIDKELREIAEGDALELRYFIYDPGPDGSGGHGEGRYTNDTGILRRIDLDHKKIKYFSETDQEINEVYFEDVVEFHKI